MSNRRHRRAQRFQVRILDVEGRPDCPHTGDLIRTVPEPGLGPVYRCADCGALYDYDNDRPA